MRRVSASSSNPSNSAAIQSGTEAPIRAEKFRIWLKFETGMMPGTIGTEMPAASARSMKRRKVSVSKKYWVIARVAPASILRFRLSRSASAERAEGCVSG
ncbi:hypothetical protein ROTAS13_00359 [Roseomonas sp. TAS13]|nr:hypothetical protein ROTAS13_00359 [Roseomonas sp. TAS13]